MKYRIIIFLSVAFLALGTLVNQIYAKGGTDDPSGDDRGGSSNRGSSSGRSSNESSREDEIRGREAEGETEVRGRDFELRGREAEGELPRGSDSILFSPSNSPINFRVGGVSPSVSPENRIEIENENEFEINGVFDSGSDDSINVSGLKVFVDPSRPNSLQQIRQSQVGKKVRVQGVIVNGRLTARQVQSQEDNRRFSNRGPGSRNSGHGNGGIFGQIFSLFRSLFPR